MHLHEYQAKEFLGRYGIASPPFIVVSSAEEAKRGLGSLEQAVVKVQVHAGGRGKAGGVRRLVGKEKILEAIEELIGFRMVNKQTGPSGIVVEKLMVGPSIDIDKEYYLAVVIDREKRQLVLIASSEGGMEIEEVAAENPEKILTIPLYDDGRIRGFQGIRLAKFLGWEKDIAKQGIEMAGALVKAFIEMDASLVEINPLVKTTEGKLFALDAKVTIDDNALFRQELLRGMEDLNQLPEAERKARNAELAYVALDGDIGCMVNGAGLAMATMDIIQLFGGRPANFLDVGGSATEEKVADGFAILLRDPHVKAILVNIFGGIMNCQTIASGLIAACKTQKVHVPLVVRLEGTNVEEGKRMLKESGLPIISASSLSEAAELIVKMAKGKK